MRRITLGQPRLWVYQSVKGGAEIEIEQTVRLFELTLHRVSVPPCINLTIGQACHLV